MASRSGTQGFVAERNVDARAGSPKLDLNDLKVKSSTKADKKQRTKPNNNDRRERDQSGRQSRNQENASLRSNASSTDALSTTASTTRQRSGKKQRLQTRSASYDRNGTTGEHQSAAFGGTDYDEEFDNDQDLPVDPAAQNYKIMLMQSRGEAGGPTIGQVQIKGDSMPATSAGIPSVTDQHDRTEGRAQSGIHNLPFHAAERASFNPQTFRQQLQPVNARRQLATSSIPHLQGQTVGSFHQPQDMKPINQEPGPDFDVNAGFSFAQAPTNRNELAVHPSHLKPQAPKQRPATTEVKAPAHRTQPKEPEKRAVRQPIADTDGRASVMDRHAYQPEQLPPAAKTSNYNNNSHGTPDGQHQMTEQGPPSEAFTEEDPSEQLEQEKYNDYPLDYEHAELYKKDYQSLKAQPFDQCPNAEPFVISNLPDTATLADKVLHVGGTDPKTQGEFFASLNIDEWEDAGDWFLDQFGDTIKALKDVRREKRTAARAFEDEIELREADVNKKRSLTNVAMSDMKSTGAAVLMGTPGRKTPGKKR